eukprot:CCRYP_017676-RA/>CCRYP_017676-RA protein AED:0.06 eAED:0.06 QI:52/1/1/1/1/1/3/165/420
MSIAADKPLNDHRRTHPMDAPLSSRRDHRSSSRSRSRSRNRDHRGQQGRRRSTDRSREESHRDRGHYGPSKREDRGHDDRYERRRDGMSDFHRGIRDDREFHGDRRHHAIRAPPAAGPSHLPVKHSYRINFSAPTDDKLVDVKEDPRGSDPTRRITQKAKRNGNGRNTESFDPSETLVRPDLRVWVGSKDKKEFDKKLKHDDVVIIPELFGPESDWSTYYTLVSEMTALQAQNPSSEWISWHEGAHLISKKPEGSPTFEKIVDRLCEYFKIQKSSIGTRFNWYRDSSDWKPFHHDSAAFNPQRARTQNITVGVSFGACRELAFIRAVPQQTGDKVKVYFPQTNNGVFSFGRDVNILWKHGVNALPEEDQDGKGRISIIIWGLADGVVEEEGSPRLLGSDGQGPHARREDGRGGHARNRRR